MKVLISEVAGPGRWGQFNLKLPWVPLFFGKAPGNVKDVHLVQIDADGHVITHHHVPEIHKPNTSNWAFEIPGASDLKFPGKQNRPIMILAQTAKGYYPFELVMPGEPPYKTVKDFLVAHRQTPAHHLSRCIVERSDIPSGKFGLSF